MALFLWPRFLLPHHPKLYKAALLEVLSVPSSCTLGTAQKLTDERSVKKWVGLERQALALYPCMDSHLHKAIPCALQYLQHQSTLIKASTQEMLIPKSQLVFPEVLSQHFLLGSQQYPLRLYLLLGCFRTSNIQLAQVEMSLLLTLPVSYAKVSGKSERLTARMAPLNSCIPFLGY